MAKIQRPFALTKTLHSPAPGGPWSNVRTGASAPATAALRSISSPAGLRASLRTMYRPSGVRPGYHQPGINAGPAGTSLGRDFSSGLSPSFQSCSDPLAATVSRPLPSATKPFTLRCPGTSRGSAVCSPEPFAGAISQSRAPAGVPFSRRGGDPSAVCADVRVSDRTREVAQAAIRFWRRGVAHVVKLRLLRSAIRPDRRQPAPSRVAASAAPAPPGAPGRRVERNEPDAAPRSQ